MLSVIQGRSFEMLINCMGLRCLEDTSVLVNSCSKQWQSKEMNMNMNMNKDAEWSPASKGSEIRYKGAHLKGKLKHLAYLVKYIMAILALFL